MPDAQGPTPAIALSLDAVIVAVTEERPRLLAVSSLGPPYRLPSGPLEPDADSTLERGLRRLLHEQTGLDVGYVEQLYTFGDRRRRRAEDGRLISVAYLALVREEQPSPDAAWLDYYTLFPWEDHREARPEMLDAMLVPELARWAEGNEARQVRLTMTFGASPATWDPIRVLERYELLYEARLVAEAFVDRGLEPPATLSTGVALADDHRRIAANALGRLRGKLTYRPVVFELLANSFTLTQLQSTVETLSGIRVHKQNFRRLIERTRLVEATDQRADFTGGRPAKLFRFRQDVLGERPRPGVLRARF